MKKLFIAAVFVALGVSSVPAQASQPVETATDALLSAATDEQKIVVMLAINNLWAVKSARLAAQQARNAEVKEYAREELEEHEEVTEELAELATKVGLVLPTELPAEIETLFKRLAELQGNRFDRIYLHSVIESHRSDVSILSIAINSRNADVKEFAKEFLPKLREHLNEAKELLQKLPLE